MTKPAPIALFTFNRPTHTQATLDALRVNELADESEISIFCDGPRAEEDEADIAAVRNIANAAKGFKRVEVIERSQNFGLARSIITGVTSMLEEHPTVIVVEDDLVTSPFFLRFMNDALNHYADDERVISVCGYSYPLGKELPETYFLVGAHCWGWATWRRGWALFEEDPRPLLAQLEQDDDLLYEFDRSGSYPHTQFLQRVAAGDGESWALRWMASATVLGKLTLYPGRSLVSNTGMDASGTNAPSHNRYETQLAEHLPHVGDVEVRQHERARRLMRAFHVNWRKTWRLKFRLFYLLTTMLPESAEKISEL